MRVWWLFEQRVRDVQKLHDTINDLRRDLMSSSRTSRARTGGGDGRTSATQSKDVVQLTHTETAQCRSAIVTVCTSILDTYLQGGHRVRIMARNL